MRSNNRRIVLANKLFQDKSVTLDDICATLKISRTTLYRYVRIGSQGSPSATNRMDNGTTS